MSISLYDVSVATFQQMLGGMINVLDKGAQHFSAKDKSADEMVNESLYHDMLPFSFQVHSVVMHSLGCIQALESGVWQPSEIEQGLSYSALQALLADTLQQLQNVTPEQVAGYEGGKVVVKAGEMELPFTAENFVLSMALPNFYFHVTTAYGLLRKQGVEIGKIDFLGALRLDM